jgi:hypothetical protein
MLGWNGAAPISAAQVFKSVALGYPSDQRNDYATILPSVPRKILKEIPRPPNSAGRDD